MSAIRSMPVTRRPVHTRRIECAGYERSDGLFDIEGHMIDTKADDANLIFKVVPAGSPIHDMRIVVTVDSRLVIHRIEARTEAAPSRYCAEINAAYACLAGVAIGAGFMKEVRRRLAGTSGCTHLSELLGPIATTAIQTLIGLRASERSVKSSPTKPTCQCSIPAMRGARTARSCVSSPGASASAKLLGLLLHAPVKHRSSTISTAPPRRENPRLALRYNKPVIILSSGGRRSGA